MGPVSGSGLGFGVAAFAIHIIISLNMLIDRVPKIRSSHPPQPDAPRHSFFTAAGTISKFLRLATCATSRHRPPVLSGIPLMTSDS